MPCMVRDTCGASNGGGLKFVLNLHVPGINGEIRHLPSRWGYNAGQISFDQVPVMTPNLLKLADELELDRGAYELRRSGKALRLSRIPMELLLLLVERRGDLVTREEIIDRIWGKNIFLDTDNSINAAIRKLRQVLDEDMWRTACDTPVLSAIRIEVLDWLPANTAAPSPADLFRSVELISCWQGGYVRPFLDQLREQLRPHLPDLAPMFSLSTETVAASVYPHLSRVGALPIYPECCYEFLPRDAESVGEPRLLLLSAQ